MKKNRIVLNNRGMARDTSVSKVDVSGAYENRNIRILSRDHDTLLSVTNERGNKEIPLSDIKGTVIGWNVLGNYIILFTHLDDSEQTEIIKDQIYVINYDGNDNFNFIGNKGIDNKCIYAGDLSFDCEHPIESIVYYESDDIQKIYWIDGKNVLRFMNFVAEEDVRNAWDDTSFDSNRAADFGVQVRITKDNTAELRPNGVMQYLITYYDRYGHETSYVWMSDLVYLSPEGRGGAADEKNNNSIKLEISNLDTSFTHFRVYSIFRSSYNGGMQVFLVGDYNVSDGTVTVVDDGVHVTAEDTSRLLYLGSKAVIPGTMTHKDDVLFLGNLKSVGRKDYTELQNKIYELFFASRRYDVTKKDYIYEQKPFEDNAQTYWAYRIDFVYSTDNIPNVKEEGLYPYENQLKLTSSEILSFKGGEKYRFAIKMKRADGTETDAFWIGDRENPLYPVMKEDTIQRVCASCILPTEFVEYLKTNGYSTIQLLIAEATSADRAIKAQGIVNPTMFNIWERYQNRIYAVPSWISRVRNSIHSYYHFDSINNADLSTGEIQCNWWADGTDHLPYFQYKDYNDYTDPSTGTTQKANPTYLIPVGEDDDHDKIMLVYRIKYRKKVTSRVIYTTLIYAIKVKMYSNLQEAVSLVDNAVLSAWFPDEIDKNGAKQNEKEFYSEWSVERDSTTGKYSHYKILYLPDGTTKAAKLTLVCEEFTVKTIFNQGGARGKSYNKYVNEMISLGLEKYIVKEQTYTGWCVDATHARGNHTHRIYVNQNVANYNEYPDIQTLGSLKECVNISKPNQSPNADRWIVAGELSAYITKGEYAQSYYKKNFMFIDENVITIDSPEIHYGSSMFDSIDANIRIVGVAKMSAITSDYTIDATHSNVDGMSYDMLNFSGNIKREEGGTYGLISWPLWRDYSLELTRDAKEKKTQGIITDEDDYESSDYQLGPRIIRYMLYMWHSSGVISGFAGKTETTKKDADSQDSEEQEVKDNKDYSVLNKKVFANLRFSHHTIYTKNPLVYEMSKDVETIRIAQELGSSSLGIQVNGERQEYIPDPNFSISMPGNIKYPLYYFGSIRENVNEEIVADGYFLKTNRPIQLMYSTSAHAVVSLKTYTTVDNMGIHSYRQTILPRIWDNEKVDYSDLHANDVVIEESGISRRTNLTGALLPWIQNTIGKNYLFVDNSIPMPTFFYTKIVGEDNYLEASVEPIGLGKKYVDVLSAAIDYFVTSEVYITVKINNDGVIKNEIVRLNDIDISYNQEADVYDLVFINPVIITPPSSTMEVNYVEASSTVHTDTGIEYKGLGLLLIDANIITGDVYPYFDYSVDQKVLDMSAVNLFSGSQTLNSLDQYMFIAEIVTPFQDGDQDIRYGGVRLNAVEKNRFIVAGNQYNIKDLVNYIIYANQGDTYIQRFDALRIKPYSLDALNGIIDITSVMLETHINLDGRTDLYRNIPQIASINTEDFGKLNKVYSQENNYIISRDLDDKFNYDTYKSTITWTLPKSSRADIDEWSHITLASTLDLDGDKGTCNALRRFNDNIFAFQDKGISQIMFNARTALSTNEGVPVEIANSNKVQGKHYITNKYGCINKWSIVEGKAALYFVDNINKAFCSLSASGISDISTGKGFKTWFATKNSMKSWTPKSFDNIVSYFDRIHSDVYLVRSEDNVESPALVYNENLGEFTSFYDYGSVLMMANVSNRFVSVKHNKLWLQNEGLYCNFFGNQYDFWTVYRGTPNPYSDKIWTNVEYRADFYNVLNNDSFDVTLSPENLFTDGMEEFYVPNETFDFIRVWDEYQTTEPDENKYSISPEKKFRIWRFQIPRAVKTDTNPHGLDRIRNPWINILFKKKYSGPDDPSNRHIVQIHDLSIDYFE